MVMGVDNKDNVKRSGYSNILLATIYEISDAKRSRTLMFQKIFAKLKLSPALLRKIPSFLCLVFKNENK